MTTRSRVPDIPDMDPALYEFLHIMDRRQLTVSNITEVATTPTVEELAAAVNAILQAHKVR